MCRRMTLSVGLHARCGTAARHRDWHVVSLVPMPCAHSAVHCCRTLLCHVQKGNGRTQNRETRAALNTPEDLPPLPDSSDRLGLGGQGIGAPVSLGTGRRSDEGPSELALDASLRAIPVDAAAAAVQARSESDPRLSDCDSESGSLGPGQYPETRRGACCKWPRLGGAQAGMAPAGPTFNLKFHAMMLGARRFMPLLSGRGPPAMLDGP